MSKCSTTGIFQFETTPLLGFSSLEVDISNLSMGDTLTSGLYQGYDSDDGIFPLRSDCEPDSIAGIFPTWRSGSSLRCWDFSHSELMHPICRWVMSPLQVSFQFTNNRSGEPMIARNTWYIHENFILNYPLFVLVSCDYRLEASRIPKKIQSPRYYLNITFMNVCIC